MREASVARRLLAPAVCLTIASIGTAQAQSQEAARSPTSISQAVAEALRSNPDALSSDYDVKEKEAQRAGVRGQFGPRLHADANATQWNSPFNLQFVGTSSLTVREAFTWTASVSVIQPITPLLAIYDAYKIQDLGVDVAAIKRLAARRELALRVVEAYYRLLEAERLSVVADASVTQLESQEKQARSLFDNGVVGKNDLLRAGLALAGARLRAIQSRGQVDVSRSRLDTLMGRSPEDPVEAAAFIGDPPPAEERSAQAAEEHAVAQRLELRALDRNVDQAGRGVGLAKQKLLPQVNAIGNYTHFEGSAFQQADAAYVGLFASWDVFDWGTTLSGIHEADARLQQARLARKKLEGEVRLEARQAFVDAATAGDALAVARTAVSQAEENYRIVSKKFEASAATSFDVVDAEAVLTQARGQVEASLYDLLVARATLERATGAPLPGET
jgi:outer membrane protein